MHRQDQLLVISCLWTVCSAQASSVRIRYKIEHFFKVVHLSTPFVLLVAGYQMSWIKIANHVLLVG